MQKLAATLLIALSALAPACMHVAGIVEEYPGRPSTSAVLAVGRPGGIGVSTTHRVDSKGKFDFYMSAVDENDLYVYDSHGDPQHTMRRVDRKEISDHMKLIVPSGQGRTDLFPGMP
jgi:hypothetical protein